MTGLFARPFEAAGICLNSTGRVQALLPVLNLVFGSIAKAAVGGYCTGWQLLYGLTADAAGVTNCYDALLLLLFLLRR